MADLGARRGYSFLLIGFCFFVSLFLALVGPRSAVALARDFSDVALSHKYYSAIDLIAARSIVQGYEDGSYRPDNQINRAEFLKIIMLAVGESATESEGKNYRCFNDVAANQWYTTYVCAAKEAGLVSGYNDGNFRPATEIKFVEALKIVTRAMNIVYDDQSDPWYRGLIENAARNNLIPLSLYSFDQKITRGEMADLIARFLMNKEGQLEVFLAEKKNFKVTYSSLENKILVEKDWLNHLNKTAAEAYSPTELAEDISLGLPKNGGRIFRGDGEYVVTGGDQVFLNNGVVAEVASISKSPAKDYFMIYFNYYLRGKRLNFLPVVISQNEEDYGIRIEVNTTRTVDSDPRYFSMRFTGTKILNSPADLYLDCLDRKKEQNFCLQYSVFEPLPGESVIKEGPYQVIFPEQESALGRYFLEQMRSCLPEITRESGLDPKLGIVPLRLFYSPERTVITNRSGIFWPIGEDDRDRIVVDQGGGCFDPIVVHELVHFLILPAPVPAVINESLAYYLEKRIIDRLFDSETKTIALNQVLKSNESFQDTINSLTLTFLGGAADYEQVGIFRFSNNHNNESKEIGFAVGTSSGSDSFWRRARNLIVELKTVRRGRPFEADFNLYQAPPPRAILFCDEKGWRNVSGWRTENGNLLSLFNFAAYNFASREQKNDSGPYYPLNKYLQADFPWEKTYQHFYASGACMWREYLGQEIEKIKTVFALVDEFRDAFAGEEEDFLPALKAKMGPDFARISEKWGL